MSEFHGFVDEHGVFKLDHPSQFKALIARRFNGCEVTIDVYERRKKRSNRQNAGFHAMIAPWCREEGHEPDELKRDLLIHVFGSDEKVNPITGEVKRVPRKPHTSQLTVQEFSDLIEQTLVIAAECGVILEAPDEYTKRKEARARRKRAA